MLDYEKMALSCLDISSNDTAGRSVAVPLGVDKWYHVDVGRVRLDTAV